MALQIIQAALPLGDDTPILLYCILGLLAVALIVAMVLMGKHTKQDSDDKQSGKRNQK